MEIQATAKSVRISPRKIRLVADMIRKLSIEDALLSLAATPKRAALPLAKTLKSAVANAVNNSGLSPENLFIYSINISEGASLKRFIPSTRGRIHPYKKRSSHIKIVLKSKVISPAPQKAELQKVEDVKSETVKKEKPVKENKKAVKGGKK